MVFGSQVPALGLEKEYGEKIDKCITDAFIKVGAGALVGGVFSLVLFKRKAWPVTLGTGIGLGLSYRNCEDNLRRHYMKESEEPASLANNVPRVEKVPVEEKLEINLDAAKHLSETLILGDSEAEKAAVVDQGEPVGSLDSS